MCIALPNDERTFTVTLFLPNEGDPSFATVRDGADARALFERDFADALPLIPALEEDFERNPAGLLATLYLDRWHLGDRAVLLGDAAHAMVPFHGQGMNCAFEDCVALRDLMRAHGGDTAAAFEELQRSRKPHTDAIAGMALANFVEMRDTVASPLFRLKKKLEHALHRLFPEAFLPLYNMVSFSLIPYAEAQARAARQKRAIRRGLIGGGIVAAIALGAAVWALVS